MTRINPTLWALSEQFLAMSERMLETGDLTPEMEAEFDELQVAFPDKMDRCSEFRSTLYHHATFNGEEADRLYRCKKAYTTSADSLGKYMLRCMLNANLRSLRNASGTRLWTVKKTPGRLVIEDLSAIPERYLIKPEPKPDNKAIRDAIAAGVPIAAHIERDDTLVEF